MGLHYKQSYAATRYTCPICCKSLGDMSVRRNSTSFVIKKRFSALVMLFCDFQAGFRGQDEPFAWESREFLRKMCIGKVSLYVKDGFRLGLHFVFSLPRFKANFLLDVSMVCLGSLNFCKDGSWTALGLYKSNVPVSEVPGLIRTSCQ